MFKQIYVYKSKMQETGSYNVIFLISWKLVKKSETKLKLEKNLPEMILKEREFRLTYHQLFVF